MPRNLSLPVLWQQQSGAPVRVYSSSSAAWSMWLELGSRVTQFSRRGENNDAHSLKHTFKVRSNLIKLWVSGPPKSWRGNGTSSWVSLRFFYDFLGLGYILIFSVVWCEARGVWWRIFFSKLDLQQIRVDWRTVKILQTEHFRSGLLKLFTWVQTHQWCISIVMSVWLTGGRALISLQRLITSNSGTFSPVRFWCLCVFSVLDFLLPLIVSLSFSPCRSLA